MSTVQDPRWQAVVARDQAADGTFVYAVKTTGIYCRPSCTAKRPKPDNVSFYESSEAAEAAGFRACKRCQPSKQAVQQEQAAIIAEACRHIESTTGVPRLEELASRAGFSPAHFHRLFKAVTGVAPRAYAVAHRAERMRDQLTANNGSVTQAIGEAGFGSSGRFYEEANNMLGMTPTNYRNGGAGAEIRFAVGECSLGAVLVAQSERGICAIWLGDDAEALVREVQDRFPGARLIGDDPKFEEVVAKVVGLVDEPSLGLDLPLDVRGTAFQQRVWQALRAIPIGSTVSYSELAQQLGMPKAVRAVASACAANQLAVVIPCHRVVRTDGALSGYRWGIKRKRALLGKEELKEAP